MMLSFATYSPLKLCFLLFHLSTKIHGQVYVYCNTAVNFTSGSVYERNLNLTLSSLAANVSPTGFCFTSTGQDLDMVYGLVQCRGDVSMEDCQICANSSTIEIIKLCHNQREASIGYDYCLLQYSDRQFFSVMNSNPIAMLYNIQNVADPLIFNNQLGSLTKNISSSAASNPSRFAVGSISYRDSINIYGMMQCTRDLAENSCLRCLQDILTYFPDCCGGKQGGQIISWSCKLRYEIYSFFQLSTPPPPSASPRASPPILLEPNSTTSGTTNSTSHQAGKKNTSRAIVVTIIAVASALAVISTICACFLWRKTKTKNADGISEEGHSSKESLLMDLSTLRVATRNFSDAYKLGEGGFGPVYKGKLTDGREIAVKRLSSSSRQGLEELRTEVTLVAKLLHRNLVKLLGFCLEEKEKLLVYEYLHNGSLDKILFDQSRRFRLEWERRYKIIIGIARGLLYLHEDSQLRIVHRDLKASNILLDEQMNPKISDFGLAKLFRGSQTQGNTSRIAGTYGYRAPEYAKNGHFSTKSDVYSFGILVLEIVTGRKNSSFCNFQNLQSYSWQHWSNGRALELIDTSLGDQWPKYEVLKCIHMGLLCVQEADADRPTMSEIALMLNSYSINSPTPLRPAFFVPSSSLGLDVVKDDSDANKFDQSKSESLQQSVNDVTISELNPR